MGARPGEPGSPHKAVTTHALRESDIEGITLNWLAELGYQVLKSDSHGVPGA